MSLRKRGLTLSLTAALATASPWVGTAVINPAASAQTSFTMVSTTLTGPAGTQLSDTAHLAGFGTTDPSKHLLSENLARVFAQALSADGSVVFDCQTLEALGDLNINCLETAASGLADHSDAALVVDVGAFGQPSIAGGEVGLGIRQAKVDESSAVANLAEVSAAADVAGGLIVLDGVTLGSTHNEATASSATAQTGATIERVELLPIDKLLSLIGKSVNDLSSESLAGLAGALLPPGSADPLFAAIQALQQTNAETDQDQALLDGAVAELTDGDLDFVADAAATVQILNLATKYGASCIGNVLDCATLVALGIQSIKTAASTQLDLVRSALAETIGQLPLITFENLSIETSVQASEAGAVPTASVQWGAATVAGIELPVGWTLESLGTALQTASTAIGEATGSSLGLSLAMPQPATSSGMNGSYRVGSADLTALTLAFAPELAPGVSFSARVLSMSALAEFKPGVPDEVATEVEDDVDPVCCGSTITPNYSFSTPPNNASSTPVPGTTPQAGPPLAATGVSSFTPLGVALLWAAMCIMWLLRFTARSHP